MLLSLSIGLSEIHLWRTVINGDSSKSLPPRRYRLSNVSHWTRFATCQTRELESFSAHWGSLSSRYVLILQGILLDTNYITKKYSSIRLNCFFNRYIYILILTRQINRFHQSFPMSKQKKGYIKEDNWQFGLIHILVMALYINLYLHSSCIFVIPQPRRIRRAFLINKPRNAESIEQQQVQSCSRKDSMSIEQFKGKGELLLLGVTCESAKQEWSTKTWRVA